MLVMELVLVLVLVTTSSLKLIKKRLAPVSLSYSYHVIEEMLIADRHVRIVTVTRARLSYMLYNAEIPVAD